MALGKLVRYGALFLACQAAVVLAAGDTGRLTGSVTDTRGQSLPGANISAQGPAIARAVGTTTDADGQYELMSLPAGLYEIRVSHIGYRPKVEAGVKVVAGRATSLDFELEQAIIDLEQSVVSASRTQEKALDAPASVSVVESAEIRTQAALSVSEFVRGQPGIDFNKTGMVQSNVVVRGFNNVFSGALLTLTDNRIARVPGLRINAHNFIPVTSDDIERIEVVLGPGSALYGPNSANGVMHIITRSPFTSAGTSVKVGLGERSLRRGSFRHAGIITPQLGYKISGQYYTGEDWEYVDPEESDRAKEELEKPEGDRLAPVREVVMPIVMPDGTRRDTTYYTMRDHDLKRQSMEARLDYRPNEDLSAVVSFGHNKGDYIEMTGLGAGQAIGWSYNYVQTRMRYGGLFAQHYHNWSDAGDTFILRTGDPMIDKSTFDVIQVQHAASLGERQSFIYGLDALFTRPDTEGSIYGGNEDDDDIDEYGVYVQSETALASQLDMILALRYDTHNRLDDPVYSPRAALVYRPAPTQTVRATYNRAFSTPTTVNLYLDMRSKKDPLGLGDRLQQLGMTPPDTLIDLRAQGTYRKGFDEGFTFQGSQTGPDFRSPFAAMVPGLSSDSYISQAHTGFAWGVLSQIIVPQIQTKVGQLMTLQGKTPEEVGAVTPGVPGLMPQILPSLGYHMLRMNVEKAQSDDPELSAFPFDSVTVVHNVPRTEPTTTQTLELGYKGILMGNLVLAADVYRTETENFVGPLAVETPNVFLDATTLPGAQADLEQHLQEALADPANAVIASVVGGLDAAVLGGDEDGSAADELAANIFTDENKALFTMIPFGTVSPKQAYDPTAMILTYRNFGDVSYYGMDLSVGYYPNDIWSARASYSWTSKNYFKNVGGIDDVALNAATQKIKVSATYRLPQWDLKLSSRVRYNGDYRMKSGVYEGDVESRTRLDVSLVYELPFAEYLSLLANVDNVLDKEYRGSIGAPKVGRLVYTQLGISF